jgi:hypothetical protein
MMSVLLSLLLNIRSPSRAALHRASDGGLDGPTGREAFPRDDAPRYLIHDRDHAFDDPGPPRKRRELTSRLSNRTCTMASSSSRRHALPRVSAVVLLIEPDDDSRDMYADYLRMCGIAVQTADTADEGLKRACDTLLRYRTVTKPPATE